MDRFEAVELLENCVEDNNYSDYHEAMRMAIDALKQPEPHEGEWINTSPGYKNGFYSNSYYCSECHDYYTTSPYEMNYCPNCGAKMTISK